MDPNTLASGDIEDQPNPLLVASIADKRPQFVRLNRQSVAIARLVDWVEA
ncbi:hypothetical protein [Synechococcus sp. PCC 7336]|nr:hypothetical protein [Synechococcus sp. PCC 7336]